MSEVTEMIGTLKQFDIRTLCDIISCNGDGIIITDADQKIITANDSALRMTGYTLKEIVGQTPSVFSSGEHDERFYDHMFENLHADGVWHGEIMNKKKSGDIFPVSETITVIRNDSGDIVNYVSIMRDNTLIRATEKELKELAFRDPLTNLYNRRYFFEYLETQVNHLVRSKTSFAIVMMDLDDFSKINNNYGHDFGDDVLVSIAGRLNKMFSRKSDVLARMGGDEFIAIISNLGDSADEIYTHCEAFAKKLTRSLSQPHRIGEYAFKASASIGMAYVAADKCTDIKSIVRQADNSMYRGKKSGKNTYKIYPVEDCSC